MLDSLDADVVAVVDANFRRLTELGADLGFHQLTLRPLDVDLEATSGAEAGDPSACQYFEGPVADPIDCPTIPSARVTADVATVSPGSDSGVKESPNLLSGALIGAESCAGESPHATPAEAVGSAVVLLALPANPLVSCSCQSEPH